jgi:hypothetical protein
MALTRVYWNKRGVAQFGQRARFGTVRSPVQIRAPRLEQKRGRSVTVAPQPSKLMVRVRFPSPAPDSLGPIAQWLERPAHNRLVAGSNPAGPTRTQKKPGFSEKPGFFAFSRAEPARNLAGSLCDRGSPELCWLGRRVLAVSKSRGKIFAHNPVVGRPRRRTTGCGVGRASRKNRSSQGPNRVTGVRPCQ